MNHRIPLLVLGLVIACLPTGDVFAHKVIIFAWAEENTVYTQSKFSGGKKVVNGTVEARDDLGNLVSKGKTNKMGEYSFSVEKLGPLHIVLNAGMGHRAEWSLTTKDFSDLATGTETELKDERAQSPEIEEIKSSSDIRTERGQLESMIEQTLDKKLQPIHKMLVQQQEERVTLRDVLGGIGYIIGLIGLAAYIRYRKSG